MIKYLHLLLVVFLPSVAIAQMEFVENKGQWHSNAKYRGDFITGSIFLETQGFSVVMHDTADLRRRSEISHGHGKLPEKHEKLFLKSFAYKVKLIGANPNAMCEGERMLQQYNNYFIGNDPSKWSSNCRIFHAVVFKDVYPSIDLRYYSEGDAVKYDFVVHPGGNPAQIALRYDGPELKIVGKELHLKTPVGVVRELYPYTYQQHNGQTSVIDCRYVLKKNVVTFRMKGYDPSKTLVIDPSVIFCSFTGSIADNWGYTATPGPDGSLYAGGIVFGTGYPVSPGAFQTTYAGGLTEDNLAGFDIGIFRYSSNGSFRLYATYIGGSANEHPHSLIADGDGNLVIAGRTNSANFPAIHSRLGPGGGSDIYIAKLSADGGTLIGSRLIGGSGEDGVNIRTKTSMPAGLDLLRQNYGDDARSEVILDNNNNIILASCTQSNDFYISPGAAQSNFGGALQDGVILKFNPDLSANIFSSYFGGSGVDACFVLAVHPLNGNIYVGGGTTSNNLPGNTSGRWQPNYNGGLTDGFVTIINPAGTAFLQTTYTGTSGRDLVYGLKFDSRGFPYIMGTTTGAWPVQNAVFRNAGGKQFITKLQDDLSGVVYSTVFGTNSAEPNISPVAFLVDRCENVYVSGWGGGININNGYNNGSTAGLPMVQPLQGIPPPDGQDFYFFVLERNATSQFFGSHFGQNGGTGDHVDGGTSRFDENGVIYMAMCANCGDRNSVTFPTTPGAWAVNNGSLMCNEAVVKIEMNFAGVGSSLQTTINSVVGNTRGCVPLTVQFADTLQQGVKFYWDFGDGTTDTTTTHTNEHTFNAIGVYNVRLISEDSTTCNIRDTAYISISVGSDQAFPDFVWNKVPPCESLSVQFTNTSTRTTGNFGQNSFIWNYGDGSPPDTTNFSPPVQHSYPAPGTYFVTLTIIDTNYCNTPVSDTQRISLNPTVKAQFTTEPVGCVPHSAVFTNTSLAGTEWLWEFGDGTTSTEFEPQHVYASPGTYQVRLIATDTSTCNRVDTSAYFTITVYDRPTAIISSWGPNPPQPNTPVRFTNGSLNAVRYLWEFGDGAISAEVAPEHQYNATGTYRVMLVAYNAAGCADTTYTNVQVIIHPLLDVPNAFTPEQFGQNSVVYVRGFGIGKMTWNIYNRFGQLVFTSTSPKVGWDGTFKGKLQPMDVYAYTLDVEFTDGQTLRRTGDITLLR